MPKAKDHIADRMIDRLQSTFAAYLLTFLLIAICAPSVNAQLTDSLITSSVSAIPLTRLGAEIELTKEQLKNLDLRTPFPKSVTDIDSLIPIYEATLEDGEIAYRNFKRSHPNKQKVLNLINKWGNKKAHLGNWEKTVNVVLDKNVGYLAELDEHTKEWELTYEQTKDGSVPDNTLQLINGIRLKIDTLSEKLTDQNLHFLSLETKVLILKEKVASKIQGLENWKRTDEFSLLNQRHPAIWNSSQEKKQTSEPFKAWESFKGNIKGVYRYLVAAENNILAYGILLCVLVIFFFRSRKAFRTVDIDNKDEFLTKAELTIYRQPWFTAFFIIAIFSIIYFNSKPLLLDEVLLFLALLSTIPFVKPTSHPRFKGIAYYIVLLFLLNSVKSYVWFSSTAYRAYLLVEAVLAIFVVFRMTYPYLKTRRLDLRPLSALAVRITPLIYLIFLASIAANVLGYTNLTDTLLKMGILGGVLGIVLFGMLSIISGFIKGTIHYGLAQLDKFDQKNKLYLEKRAVQLARLFAYAFVLIYFLHVIDVYDYIVGEVESALNAPVRRGILSFTWVDVLSFLSILIGSYIITSFISRIIDGGALNFMRLPKGIPSIISVSLRYIIVAFAIVLALSNLGIDLGKFNLMAGALGLGIGFGLQNVISNFISGLILIFERPIQTEDMVEVGPLLGTVKKIGVRSSNIRTFDGAEVVVPNSNLITNEVINWTLTDQVKRIDIRIGVSYGSDINTVIDILKSCAAEHEQVLDEPPPNALFNEFGESSLDFRLLYWVPVEHGIQSKSDISILVYDRLTEAGITIPFPQRDLHLDRETIKLISTDGSKDKDSQIS